MVAVAGLGSTAAGAWIGFASSMKEDRPAAIDARIQY